MTHRIINKGFNPLPVTQDHYKLGFSTITWKIINPIGRWTAYAIVPEVQFTPAFDTCGCTVFSTLNALEMLKRMITGIESNYSDRFTYISSDTFPPGNDPHVVAETIRKVGVVSETVLPFPQDLPTLAAFRDMGPNGANIIKLGLDWLTGYSYGHEWVFEIADSLSYKEKQTRILNALKYSPVCASVRAWMQRENGMYFKEKGDTDTHWITIVDYDEGVSWTIFDNYPADGESFYKKLEWDYDFGYAKKYWLSNTPTISSKRPNWLWITIKKLFSIIHL